ncbi:hypothetical protein DMO16_04020 [Fictibacillus sp. S7]|nr:hypothetical protein DMO16_04020 [Fictibacillus sp. S7]
MELRPIKYLMLFKEDDVYEETEEDLDISKTITTFLLLMMFILSSTKMIYDYLSAAVIIIILVVFFYTEGTIRKKDSNHI